MMSKKKQTQKEEPQTIELMKKMLKNKAKRTRDKQKEIYKASKKQKIIDSNQKEENKLDE